jgi:hydantoinase/carbamoylase family amidase
LTPGEVALGRLEELYAIGGGDGANRPGLSREEEDAHALAERWMRAAGLETSRDAAGNLYGRHPGRDRDLPEIWCGSHLDTVPHGGRYDGALGVVAALGAVELLPNPLARTVAVVAFRDEEGWRFGRGFFGSRAVTGLLPPDTLDQVDRGGVSVRDALAAWGRHLDGAQGWLVPVPAAFVEAHIEQGPVLAERGCALGIVDSIVGMVELSVTFDGRAGHAGTTPMDGRADAGLSAASFQLAAADAARAIPRAVATVGTLTMEPGATNVIPARVRLVVDARAPDTDSLDRLEAGLVAAAERCAAEHGCTAAHAVVSRTAPVATHPLVREALAAAAPGAPVLPSGAGHDAQVLGVAGVPVGMLFSRSRAGGISHSPLEHTDPADVAATVEALARALPALSRALSP